MALVERYGMDDAERRHRQHFLGITESDAVQLRALRPVFAARAEEFAERFYQHLLRDERTASLLADPEQLARLKKIQAAYFAELLEGVFDHEYFEKRLRVGQAHHRVGLEPVDYLSAYNQYVQITFPHFREAFGNNYESALPALLSLVKVIFLDIGLALDTYFRESTEMLRRHNEELQQALGLYMQAQRREEQLRKLLSHEVRGGLAAIITTLEDLLDVLRPGLDSASSELLESVNRRCWSLSGLLGEMLASARGGGPTWVDTAEIFETIVARFGMYAEGREVHLVLPEHPPRVWADAMQLREVFANLVSNAVRYLDKEPGKVEIGYRAADAEFFEFTVADNGPGIPPSIQARLFEPFVRGPANHGRQTGTGLGLYFVKTIIEQGGGRIWVETTPGEGTRFQFTVARAPLRPPHLSGTSPPGPLP